MHIEVSFRVISNIDQDCDYETTKEIEVEFDDDDRVREKIKQGLDLDSEDEQSIKTKLDEILEGSCGTIYSVKEID